ncbi:Gfo/Idh/MocA family protein [Paenibacillus koleovorans]|uniref:Gfo/Idh/MocA family protein n=1 Tax=Paenibacillus koleovorans TaxID=121608 RepID=UPI001FE50E97|nr:Gfo/Idh/MocA family oxidoreductase [Paenibacillus koleovorans]
MLNIGIIGYGSRIRNVFYKVKENFPECKLVAIADIRNEEIRSKYDGLEEVRFYDTFEDMHANEKLDGIMIGTRCSLHTTMARKVLPTGIPLFLEKPVSTTMEDYLLLQESAASAKSEVVVSFPMRLSRIVKLAKEIIDSGKIGSVEHVAAQNYPEYGGVYFHNWYRDEQETGGLFLQKATHDFDYINYLVGQKPVSVVAMTSKQIFKGTKPAGLRCVDCAENQTCEESTVHLKGIRRETWAYCAFAEDTGNEDSGSALIRYENGMHVSYTQNFYSRKKSSFRGARFTGYKGTLELDFHGSQIKVYMHHTPRVETYDIEMGNDHFGGDTELVKNFVKVMKGEGRSVSTLEDGLLSALMCLKAKQSAETGMLQSIE